MPLPSATPAPRPGNQLLPPTCFSATTTCRPTNAPHACRPAMTRAPRSPADRDPQLLLPPGAAWGPRSELCASLPASGPPLDACTPCISTLPTPRALEAATAQPRGGGALLGEQDALSWDCPRGLQASANQALDVLQKAE